MGKFTKFGCLNVSSLLQHNAILHNWPSTLKVSCTKAGTISHQFQSIFPNYYYYYYYYYYYFLQNVNRMPRNRLPRIMKHYSPTGRRNHGRQLKRLLDTWARNGSTRGPTPRNIDYYYYVLWLCSPARVMASPYHEVSKSHTTRHSRKNSSERVISSSQRPVPDNTQHIQQTNIHAPGGIRTHDRSRRAAVDLRLRPRNH
jgi:hypothetical protein